MAAARSGQSPLRKLGELKSFDQKVESTLANTTRGEALIHKFAAS